MHGKLIFTAVGPGVLDKPRRSHGRTNEMITKERDIRIFWAIMLQTLTKFGRIQNLQGSNTALGVSTIHSVELPSFELRQGGVGLDLAYCAEICRIFVYVRARALFFSSYVLELGYNSTRQRSSQYQTFGCLKEF
jgi:hypothetical protein